eukprot:2641622-Amphidinium_carterae.1
MSACGADAFDAIPRRIYMHGEQGQAETTDRETSKWDDNEATATRSAWYTSRPSNVWVRVAGDALMDDKQTP